MDSLVTTFKTILAEWSASIADMRIEFRSGEIIRFSISDIYGFRYEIHQSSKYSKCNNTFYRWFITIFDNEYQFNLLKTHSYRFFYTCRCSICGTTLNNRANLSTIIKLKNNTDLKANLNFCHRCKSCSASRSAIIGQEASKKTCLERYGVEHSFQSQNNIDKSKQTKIERYGENFGKIISANAWKNYKEKTGYAHNMHNPVSLKKMVKSWKKTVSSMTPEAKKMWHKRRMDAYNKPSSPGFYGVNIRPLPSISSISQELFETLDSKLSEKMWFGKNEQSFGTKRVDCVIIGCCIIEFFGSYWHADPIVYESIDTIRYPGSNFITAQQKWDSDHARLSIIQKETSLPILLVWENDYLNNKDLIVGLILEEINKIRIGEYNAQQITTIHR